MQNFKVTYFLRKDREDSQGRRPITVQIHLNGKRLTIGATGLSVKVEQWNPVTFEVKGRNGEALETNHKLQCLTAELNRIFRMNEYNDGLSLQSLKSQYLSTLAKPTTSQSFITFFEEYLVTTLENVGKTIVRDTYTRYVNTLAQFKDFLERKRHRSDISFAELNYELVSDFERYLRIDMDYDNQNTVMKKMRVVKTVMLTAQKMGKMQHDPFIGYKIKFNPVDRGFLTDEEVKALMAKKFGIKRLELVRDLFIFSCFTGLAYIDATNLTAKNIVVMNRRKWIMIHRKKTDVPTNIILMEIPERILEKYKDVAPDGKLLPMLSSQKINSYLKEIADICGIKKNLTFHIARHTFATMALSKGVPIETVSKMLGHNNISTTQIYARITNKKVEEDMDKLSEKLDFDDRRITEEEPDFKNSRSKRLKKAGGTLHSEGERDILFGENQDSSSAKISATGKTEEKKAKRGRPKKSDSAPKAVANGARKGKVGRPKKNPAKE